MVLALKSASDMNNYFLTKKGPMVRPPEAGQFAASISAGTAPIRCRLNEPDLEVAGVTLPFFFFGLGDSLDACQFSEAVWLPKYLPTYLGTHWVVRESNLSRMTHLLAKDLV